MPRLERSLKKMKIYQLEPNSTAYTGWKHSRYKGELVVRAEDENDARKIASRTLGCFATYRTGEETSFCPWDMPQFVSCVLLADSRFSVDGRREVLFPPDWDFEFPDSPNCGREH